MFAKKKNILISFNYNSNNNGSGTGYYTASFRGRFNDDRLHEIIDGAKDTLKDFFKDNTDYFNIVITNIVGLDRL